MIRCKLCKRITEKGESTGKFTTYAPLEKGKKILNELIVCINCSGECLFKWKQ